MVTYLWLSVPFLAMAVLTLLVCGVNRRILKVLVLMIMLSVVFDSLIIAVGIVDYDYSKTLGLRLILAPLEDMFYPVFSTIFAISAWRKLT